jgi:hypothetical protein
MCLTISCIVAARVLHYRRQTVNKSNVGMRTDNGEATDYASSGVKASKVVIHVWVRHNEPE